MTARVKLGPRQKGPTRKLDVQFDPSQFPKVNLKRMFVSGTLALIGCAGLVFVFVMRLPDGVRVKRDAAVLSDVEAQLDATLRELRAAWKPVDRERILADAARRGPAVAGVLQRMIRAGESPLLPQAIEYAGATGILELREPLTAIARAQLEVRPRNPRQGRWALLAANALAPFPADELEEFLVSPDIELQQGAIEASRGQELAPWQRIVALMFEAPGPVSETCFDVMADAPPAVADLVWERVSSGRDEALRIGLVALARLPNLDPAATGARLAKALRFASSSLQADSLDLIIRLGPEFVDTAAMLSLATDASESRETRTRAMRCLELTGAFEPDELQRAAFFLDPYGRYLFARCLLRTGDADGAAHLLDLVEGDDPEASTAARQLLGWLTGRSPASTRREFESTLEGTPGALDRAMRGLPTAGLPSAARPAVAAPVR